MCIHVKLLYPILFCFVFLFSFFFFMKVGEARSLDRDVVETGLTFAGFAVSNKSFYFLAVVISYPTQDQKKKGSCLIIHLLVVTFCTLVILHAGNNRYLTAL